MQTITGTIAESFKPMLPIALNLFITQEFCWVKKFEVNSVMKDYR